MGEWAVDIDCVVLAAGESRRMGVPKQELPLGGKPLAMWALDTALANCRRVVVVEGAIPMEWVTRHRPRVEVVRNPEFAAGQLGSLQVGLRSLETGAAFIMLADLPFVLPTTFLAVARAAEDASATAAYPTCRERRGHPVLLGAEAIRLILAASPADRAMKVITPLEPLAVSVDDPGIYRDVDTPEDYRRRGGGSA